MTVETLYNIRRKLENLCRIESCEPYEVEGYTLHDVPTPYGNLLLRRDVIEVLNIAIYKEQNGIQG